MADLSILALKIITWRESISVGWFVLPSPWLGLRYILDSFQCIYCSLVLLGDCIWKEPSHPSPFIRIYPSEHSYPVFHSWCRRFIGFHQKYPSFAPLQMQVYPLVLICSVRFPYSSAARISHTHPLYGGNASNTLPHSENWKCSYYQQLLFWSLCLCSS